MKMTTIGESCSLHARIGWQGLTKKEYLDEGDYYLVTGVDFDHCHIAFDKCHYVTKDRYDQDQNIQIGVDDVLVTKDGTIGKVAIIDSPIDKPATLNSGVFVVRPKNKEQLLPRYLMIVLQSNHFNRFIERIKVGCTIAHLNQEKFLGFDFPLPSIDEQKHIIAVFETLFTVLNKRQKELSTLDVLIKARFVEMFSSIKEEQLLGEISEFVTVGIANSATHAYAESGIPMLRNQNIRENYLDDTDLIYIKPEFAAKYESKKLKENDIIAMRTGYPGIACLVPKKYEGCQTFTTLIVRLKPGNNPSYVCSYINSDLGKGFIDSGKVGVAQQNFGAKSLAKMPIKIASKELQDKYADYIKQVDKSKSRKKSNYKTKNELAS